MLTDYSTDAHYYVLLSISSLPLLLFDFCLSTSGCAFIKVYMFSYTSLKQAFMDPSQGQDPQVWTERVKHWLKELPLFQKSYSYSERTSDNLLEVGYLSDKYLPIWLAAQKAVTRYEGILSLGPRGRLLRKLLMWTGLIPSTPKIPFNLESDVTISEPYLRLV